MHKNCLTFFTSPQQLPCTLVLLFAGFLPALLICVFVQQTAVADERPLAQTDVAKSIDQSSEESGVSESSEDGSLPQLKMIPWAQDKITELFEKAAANHCCEMYGANEEIFPETMDFRLTANPNEKRLPAFSVALTMSREVQESLPRLSRKRIISYLDKHVLVLQSAVRRSPQGGLSLGTRLGAGLCLTSKPSKTLKAEPMIASAVSDFRTLGYYQSTGSNADDSQRTLVLAFRYVVADSESEDGPEAEKATEEFELIFLHIPTPSAAESDNMVVFATSDGRTRFHALAASDPNTLTHSPTIVASVRFDHFKYFGLYPTRPVVTGLNLRSRLSVPAEEIQTRLSADSRKGAVSLWQLLNEMHAKAVAPATLSQTH